MTAKKKSAKKLDRYDVEANYDFEYQTIVHGLSAASSEEALKKGKRLAARKGYKFPAKTKWRATRRTT